MSAPAVGLHVDQKDPWLQANEEFACDHPRAKIVVKIAANGSRYYRKQCQKCGDTKPINASALTYKQRQNAQPFDEVLQTSTREAKRKRYEELIQERSQSILDQEKQRKAEFDRWYAEYLRSPQWQAKRVKVLARAGGRCEGCGELRLLVIHHKSYAQVGQEMLFDLAAVCRECHDIIHAKPEAKP